MPTLGVAALALGIECLLALNKISSQLAPGLGKILTLGQAQFVPSVERVLAVLRPIDPLLPASAWLAQLIDDLPAFFQPLIGQRLANLRLELGQGGLVFLAAFRRVYVNRRRTAAGHDAVKRVIILLTNRVEFVVVAARTRHGQTEECLGHHIDLILGRPHQLIEGVGGREPLQNEPIVRRADRRLV